MGSGDFLRKDAHTPHTEQFLIAGVVSSISTNSPEIISAARECFCTPSFAEPGPKMQWRLWVDPNGKKESAPSKPTFRGLDHLVFIGLDMESSILIDLNARRIIGRLSPAVASDQERWKTILFPNLISLIGPAVGITGLHCACVARNGEGMLLVGASGAGKSSLTMAFAKMGFEYLSDDWTYFSMGKSGLHAWGLIPRLKLLPAAVQHFPELSKFNAKLFENGEEAFEINPFTDLGFSRRPDCKPVHIVFLERLQTPEFSMTEVSPSAAAAELQQHLIADTQEALQPQFEVIHRLVERGTWRLRYGDLPDVAARKLSRFFA